MYSWYTNARFTVVYVMHAITLNLQAAKLFIVTPATKGWVVTTPPGFRVRFKILYRVIQPLIRMFYDS